MLDYRSSNQVILRPAVIDGIYDIQFVTSNENNKFTKHCFVIECHWFKKHVYVDEFGIFCLIKVWSNEFENNSDISNFIPIQFIKSKIACISSHLVYNPTTRIYTCHYRQAYDVKVVILLTF